MGFCCGLALVGGNVRVVRGEGWIAPPHNALCLWLDGAAGDGRARAGPEEARRESGGRAGIDREQGLGVSSWVACVHQQDRR